MWPFGKKREENKPTPELTSPGGSVMLRYGGHEFDKPQFGVLGEESIEWAKRREAVYEEMFGTIGEVFHEVLPMIPHIDVYQFKPGYRGRDFWTLVTSGMSDLAMSLPSEVPKTLARTELIFYCDKPEKNYLNLLRVLSHFPHDNKTWLGEGHTMPNGNPPAPIFNHTPHLTTFVFIRSILSPDNDLGKRLDIGGCPVNFLWIVPLSTEECNLKLEKGIGAIYDLFDAVHHPHVFRGDRKSYV